LDDPDSRAAVTAERSLLAALEAGCAAPLGALAEVMEGDDGPELFLRAVATSLDGALTLRRSAVGPPGQAVELGRRLAGELLADGARELVPTAGSTGTTGPTDSTDSSDTSRTGTTGTASTTRSREGDL